MSDRTTYDLDQLSRETGFPVSDIGAGLAVMRWGGMEAHLMAAISLARLPAVGSVYRAARMLVPAGWVSNNRGTE